MFGAMKIHVSRRAGHDLQRLHDFIAQCSSAHAQHAIDRILKGLALLEGSPEAGVDLGRGRRKLILKYGKSGYVILYKISGDTILITHIWHGRENRRGQDA